MSDIMHSNAANSLASSRASRKIWSETEAGQAPQTLSGILSYAYDVLKSAERCAEGVEAVKGRICDYNGGGSISKMDAGEDANASRGLVEDIAHMLNRIEDQIKRVGRATSSLEEKIG